MKNLKSFKEKERQEKVAFIWKSKNLHFTHQGKSPALKSLKAFAAEFNEYIKISHPNLNSPRLLHAMNFKPAGSITLNIGKGIQKNVIALKYGTRNNPVEPNSPDSVIERLIDFYPLFLDKKLLLN